HSWAEIYFPGYGWVEFEPTGGRAAVYRSDETDALSSASSPTTMNEGDLDAPGGGIEVSGGFNFNWILLALPAAIVGAAALFWERLSYLSLSAGQVSVRAYPAMRRLAGRLAIPLYDGYTPAQFADVLGQALKTVSRRYAFVESAVWDVSVLAKAYEDVSYRKHPGELPEKALLVRS
ncbi:MAG: hypothetical protein ACE5M4_13280, partial [Anaerolineales bacterium]